MLYFALGYVAGLVTAVLVVGVMVYFKAQIQQTVSIVQKQVEVAGPRAKGFVFIPESDADAARAERLEENRAQGKDTPISELL